MFAKMWKNRRDNDPADNVRKGMELIALNDAIEILNSEGITKNMRAHRKIASLPTVSAPEAVRGVWIWNEDSECYVCSRCELSALNDYRGNSVASEYCSHCGAEMEGDNVRV